MAISVMAWVWEHSPYDGTKLLVHLALADFANNDGCCWPSQASVARKARCSVRWVREVLTEMEGDGMLEVLKRSERGRGKTGRYRVVHSGPESGTGFQKSGTQFREKRNPTSAYPSLTVKNPGAAADRATRTCPLGQCGGSGVVEVDDVATQCECVLRSVS